MLKLSIFSHFLQQWVIWKHFTEKIKTQKNKQALVVRFIVFAIWEEFLTELGKTPWITGMQGDNNYGDPIFYLKFFQGRIYSCQLHQVWKNLYGTSFSKK